MFEHGAAYKTMNTFDPTQFTEPASTAGGQSSTPASVAQVAELSSEKRGASVRIGSEALHSAHLFWSRRGQARVGRHDRADEVSCRPRWVIYPGRGGIPSRRYVSALGE